MNYVSQAPRFDRMPPNGTGLSGCQLFQLQEWINEGMATYTESIEALVSSECSGCHSGTDPGGGLFLTNYTEISTAALTGQLVTRVMLPGSDPDAMPPGNPLYHCNLDLINAWVAAGAPLN